MATLRLPDNLSIDEGALVEPLSVVVYACERAGITVDSKLLICGAGDCQGYVIVSGDLFVCRPNWSSVFVGCKSIWSI